MVRANGRTFGFVSIDEVTAQESYLAKRIADYKKLGVDLVVCVTKDLLAFKGLFGRCHRYLHAGRGPVPASVPW